MKERQETNINMETTNPLHSNFHQANIPRHTSPNRTMTNGSIMNGNINRFYHAEVNGNIAKGGEDKFEVPLPFGYHLDLDFLRVCSEELVSDENLTKLRELKKTRRKQRKTLEALMGIKQEQKDREKRLIRDLPSTNRKISPIKSPSPPRTLPLLRPDVVHSSEFIRDALKESMVDFQETLDQYKSQDISDFDLINTQTSTPLGLKNLGKYSTFPRSVNNIIPEDAISPTGKLCRQSSNSSISSISTASSALPYNTPLSPEAYLANLPSTVMPKPDEMETNSIGSISSEMSTNTLRNIREQMARSLVKLKEYEKQVEAIPILQVKLSVLKEEKRLLMLKLKAREAKMRRDRGEHEESDGALESQALDEDMDTEDEDLDSRIARMSSSLQRKYSSSNQFNNRRARSESPFAKSSSVHLEEFISVQRKRSTSCGFNSDSSDISPTGGRKYYTQDSPEFYARKARFSRTSNISPVRQPLEQSLPLEQSKVETKEEGVNTDPLPEVKTPPPTLPKPKTPTREKASNTDPPAKEPAPPRKANHGTNTMRTRSIPKGSETELKMSDFVSKDEMEAKLQDAIFRTEEEIMGCPLLQKAMHKIEQDAMKGISDKDEEVEKVDASCQVGKENLCPFVINVGILCKLDEEKPDLYNTFAQTTISTSDSVSQTNLPGEVRKMDVSCGLSAIERLSLMHTVGVGDCKVIEEPDEPSKYRDVGVCTEKWVEVIKASKQTDTEDFAYKDTESPRVADLVLEPPAERPLRKSSSFSRKSVSPNASRRSSLKSPSVSRKSSSTSTTQTLKVNQKSQGTMTDAEMKMKMPMKDANVGENVKTRTASTSAMMLPLTKVLPEGSPLSTPDTDRPPVNLNLCDKCDMDILKVAEGIIIGPQPPVVAPVSPVIAPPSPDMPWLSKIPRPCPMENPEVSKLKSATSTGNLSGGQRSRSPMLQRSKSNLTPPLDRKFTLPATSKTPPPVRRNMGTPPPHPNTPLTGSKRAPSPLAQSPGPSTERKSFIPKFSGTPKKTATPSGTPKVSTPSSPSTESKSLIPSLIPRVVTPPALRKMFPKVAEGGKGDKLAAPDRKVVRKNTYSKSSAGVTNPDLEKIEEHPKKESVIQQMKQKIGDIKERLSGGETDSGDETETLDDTDSPRKTSVSSFPLPGSALFAPIDDNRSKIEPTKEMKAALKVLNDSLSRGSSRNNAQVTNAVNIVQQEWFKVSSTKQSSPLDVEDYLDSIEDISRELLDRVVNLVDVNGNTALHYSVSHGNFDVVSVLLDSKVADNNILNKAGYTSIMLISLAVIQNETHRAVVQRLFSIGDVNIRASQHGQTALMLAVSHGRDDMVQLLVEAGADVNIRDEDGSTALMCAAEHGHMEIVKTLMSHPDINVGATDNDGLTALSVAMEAGHRDIGVLLYANMSFSRGTSPYSSLRMKRTSSRTSVSTPTGSVRSTNTPVNVSSPIPPTPPNRSRRNSSNT